MNLSVLLNNFFVGVFVASLLVNVYLIYWFNGAQEKIKRSMTIISNQGIEKIQRENKAEEVNQAIERINEGIALSDPQVQIATSLLQQFAPDLELDPTTLKMLINHPMVQTYIKNFTGNRQPIQNAGNVSRSQYRFKGGLT